MKSTQILALICSSLVLAAPVQGQQLQVLSGLQLWLKADAGISTFAEGGVSGWADQSGKGHDAYQFDPAAAPIVVSDAVEGKPVLRFDGEEDYLEVSPTFDLGMDGDISSWFVVRMDDFATFRAVWAKTSSNLPAPTDYYALPGSGIPRVLRGDGTFNSVASVDGVRPLIAGDYMVLGFEMSGTTMTHYLNGQANGSGQIGGVLADLFTPLRIGTRDDFVTRLKGDLAELLIYDRALSEEERGELNGYLKARYGLENDPPSVSIVSPETGVSREVPTEILVQVDAFDTDGRVVSVQLQVNGRTVSTATAPPYNFPLLLRSGGEVLVVAVATDDGGAISESAPVSLTLSGGDEAALTALENLQLWLRADAGVTRSPGGAVTLWEDQSGNSHHAVAADETQAPMWIEDAQAGRPALRFDGTDDYLEVASAPGIEIVGDIASFFVVRFEDLATFRAVWGKTAGNVPRSTDYYALPGGGQPRLYRGGSEGIAEVTGVSGVPPGQYVLLGFNMEGNSVVHYMNGLVNGMGTLNAPMEDVGTPLRVGTRDDFATRMSGDIAELLIYDAALNPESLESVLIYLASKYEIPVVASANQPPSIAIASPGEGPLDVPVTLPIVASVGDSDGSVVEVSFFANGQLIGQVTEPPFQQGIRLDTAGTVVLTATARDNLGALATSEPVTLQGTGGGVNELGVLDGLQLWLSADAGIPTGIGQSVLNWADQSGNDNHAFQFLPDAGPQLIGDAVGGLPVLRFDGAEDYLIVNSTPGLALTGDLTSFFLVQFDDYATFRAVWTKTMGNQPRPLDYYLQSGSGVPVVLRGGNEGNASVAGSSSVPAGVAVILGFSQQGNTMTHYLNGRPFGSGSINVPLEDSFMPVLIGTRDDFGTRFKGDLAELLIYDRALNEDERRNAVTYLGSRYGLAIFEPAMIEVIDVPALSAILDGENVIISWTGLEGAFQLLEGDEINGDEWRSVTQTVEHIDGVNRIAVPTSLQMLFFRLQ